MADGVVQLNNGRIVLTGGKVSVCDDNCCIPPVPCVNLCIDDEAPFCLEATVGGIGNDTDPGYNTDCNSCTCMNGKVLYLGNGGGCAWSGSYSVNCHCGTGLSIGITLSKSGADHVLTATVAMGASAASLTANLGEDKPNCMTWVDEAFSLGSGDAAGNCDLSGMTLSISSRSVAGCVTPQPPNPGAEYTLRYGATFCETCGSTYPAEMNVEIDNMGVCNCGACPSLDGIYALGQVAAVPCSHGSGLCCGFAYTFPTAICLVKYLYIAFYLHEAGGVTSVIMEFLMRNATGAAYSIKAWNLGIPPLDCADPLVVGGSGTGVVDNQDGGVNACGSLGLGCVAGDVSVWI